MAIAFSYKLLSASLKHFKDRNVGNITFIALLGLFFISVFYFTSSYYWSVPQFHSIEICYKSGNLSEPLRIFNISDSVVGRIYPAEFFGYKEFSEVLVTLFPTRLLFPFLFLIKKIPN